MAVLTLAGKPIDWTNPPKATTRVLWSSTDIYGRKVTGSLRTIAHLDWMNEQVKKKFGVALRVIQPPFNSGVRASAGTHDYDACLDVYVPGVGWLTVQTFLRSLGFGCWWRRFRRGLWTDHVHGFTLPPREGRDVSDDWYIFGFKVGYLLDGGWSLRKRKVTAAQIESYYNHRSGMVGDARDDSWFPSDISKTVFNLGAYIDEQVSGNQELPKPPVKKPRTYAIQRGDTLSAIGARFGVKWQNIVKWSGIKDPNKISVGQIIYLEKP